MGKWENPWENHGKMGKSMGKPWENGKIHGKTMEKWENPWENHGKTMGKWENPWENHGKMGKSMGKPWENGKIHGKTMGKSMAKSMGMEESPRNGGLDGTVSGIFFNVQMGAFLKSRLKLGLMTWMIWVNLHFGKPPNGGFERWDNHGSKWGIIVIPIL